MEARSTLLLRQVSYAQVRVPLVTAPVRPWVPCHWQQLAGDLVPPSLHPRLTLTLPVASIDALRELFCLATNRQLPGTSGISPAHCVISYHSTVVGGGCIFETILLLLDLHFI